MRRRAKIAPRGPVAQLDRASPSEGEGRRFESHRDHQKRLVNIDFFHRDVETFIQSLEKPAIAKILRTLDLLERFGHQLGMPHSKSVASGIFELRIRGTQEVRLFYTFHKDTAVILHGFVKKINKLPIREMETAIKRKSLLDII